MVKPEWGTKRTCPKCGTRFYDLGKEDPVNCIACGINWNPEPVLKSKQAVPYEAAKPVVEPEKEDEDLAAPDLELEGSPAPTVFGLLRTARFVLLDLTGGELQLSRADARADRLDVAIGRLASERPEWVSVEAVLIRPDGQVAWAADELDDADERVRSALARWLESETALNHSAKPGHSQPRPAASPEASSSPPRPLRRSSVPA